ncbi:MAG: radical SAM protein [Myxococcales bacterium]|nr:radical SAM protein [Myxococcales bacterium]
MEFTPYVETLRDTTESALRALLGLPSAVPLRWRPRRVGAGTAVHVAIGDGADQLELDLHVPAQPAGWVVGEHFSVATRSLRDGREPRTDAELGPLLKRLGARLLAADRRGESGPWPAVERALATEVAFDGVRDRMLRMVTPEQAYVRLGFRCNQACGFCWQDRSWPEPPHEYYATWVDEIAASGRRDITFTGGEVTIHRAFFGLVERARSHGLRVTVETNAIQLAKPGFAQRMADAGVETLFISYHSHIPEVSDDMTTAPNTHLRTRAGIGEALRAGLDVSLNCVVERRNYAHLADHARHIVELFVAGMPDHPVRNVVYSHPCSYYDRAMWERNLVSLEVVRPNLLDAIDTLTDAGVIVTGVGTCGFPPCLLWDRPDKLRSFRRDEQAEGDVEGRVFAPICDTCAFRPHCLGVRNEYLERFGDEGLRAFETMPETAPPR